MIGSAEPWALKLLAAGALVALSGCALLDRVSLGRRDAERTRIYQLYGDCLTRNDGELLTLAKYCGSVAEIRHSREHDAMLTRCPLAEYFPCLAKKHSGARP
jgi:hypothetical protein